MSCDCTPYDIDKCEILDLPPHLKDTRNNQTVCVDKCIVPVIKELWKHKISTAGCCCGHGKGNPSIILHELSNNDLDKTNGFLNIRNIIREVDSREFDIYIWLLTKVDFDNIELELRYTSGDLS